MKLFLKIAGGIVAFALFMTFLVWLDGIDGDRYAEKMKEHQEWCTSQGGDFTRHGAGWGPDWSCTIRSVK